MLPLPAWYLLYSAHVQDKPQKSIRSNEQESMIELVLFENDVQGVISHMRAGINTFLVDTETLGKDFRQLGFDTEIRPGTFADLRAVSAIQGATSWCRLNSYGDHTRDEIEAAIAAAAGVIVLPMAKTLADVTGFLELVDGRCETAIMLETAECAPIASQINELPVHCVFFGLNDFAISRGGGSIFTALVDGSVERVREAMPDVRFGVAGLTDISRGSPIPCRRIMEELERLQCHFTFLRRSFRRDSAECGPKAIVDGLRNYWVHCSRRSAQQRTADHNELVKIVRQTAGTA